MLYNQYLFCNERVLPYEGNRFNNKPLHEKVIAVDVVGLPKITTEYLIYATSKKEIILLSHHSDTSSTIPLPSMKKSIDSSDMQFIIMENAVLVYLHGQIFTIGIKEKKIINQAEIRCTGLDVLSCLYNDEVTCNPDLKSFGLFDLKKKEMIWKVKLDEYCVSSCGTDKVIIVQDGKHTILALGKDTGNHLWSFNLKDELKDDADKYFIGINSVVAIFKEKIVFGSNDRLYCIDLQSGKVIWSNVLKGFQSANMSVFSNGIISSISSTSYYEIKIDDGNILNYIDIDAITKAINVSIFTKPLLTETEVIAFSAMSSRLFFFNREDFRIVQQLDVYNAVKKKKYHPAVSAGQTPVWTDNSIYTIDMEGCARRYTMT